MIDRVMHWLALLGFAVRETDSLSVPAVARHWGPVHNGFALSAHFAAPDLSIALKNVTGRDESLRIRDWMAFYVVRTDAFHTEYGRRLLHAAAAKPLVTVTIHPGSAVETDLPLDRLFAFEQGRGYQIDVTCELGVASNKVEIVL